MARMLEFFFDYASPYSYLACKQVEAVAQRNVAELRWRPFLLGAVFKATGNTPPLSNANKASWLLRDVQDWTSYLGLPPFRMPETSPSGPLPSSWGRSCSSGMIG